MRQERSSLCSPLTTVTLICSIWCGSCLLLLLPATDAVGCADTGTPCINGACNATSGSCLCPANDFLTFTDSRCDNISTIAGPAAINLTQTSTAYIQSVGMDFTGTAFQGGFPIGEGVLATSVFVCSNGYVTLNSNFCTCRIGLLASSVAPAFVAPLATSMDYRSSVGGVNSSSLVSYRLVASVDSEPSLRAMRDNVSELAGATAAIVVTWSGMSPLTLDNSAGVQSLTMQLILFTDRQKVAAAAVLYSQNSLKHYFDWLPTFAGWKAGWDSPVVNLAGGATRRAVMTYATSGVSVGGSGVKARLRVIPLYRNATAALDYRALCVDESLLLSSSALLPASVATAGSCPQTWRQARSDPRYIREAAPSDDRQAASLLVPHAVENTTQLTCVYHSATGALLVHESGVKVVSNSVSLGASLHDYCCVRAPELCQLYYNKFPQPSSAGYVQPKFAGFVTGAGLFKTFDGHQYKYMDTGDYWLLSNDKLRLQIRMQTVNLVANNTALVTAVAVQFTGSTNFSIEIHWSQTTGGIASWHYSVNQGRYESVTATSVTQTAVSNNAVATGSETKLVCYTMNTATWIEVLSSSHGLTVTAYIDKAQLGSIAGPLGDCDVNSENDLAYRNGTVLSQAQQTVQTTIDEALLSWSMQVNESSLFRMWPTPPVREAANWTALHWSPAWDNQTALCLALFQGNETVCNASAEACASKASNTTSYRHCVLEFADCLPAGAVCSAAYLALLDATVPSVLADLACSPPQWNTTAIEPPLSVVDGVAFAMALSTLTAAGTPSGAVFSKVAGPPGLSVLDNGNLTWLPNQTETTAPILIGLADAARSCVSLWPVRVRMTRRTGLCTGNATEGFGLQAAAGTVTQQNQVTFSSCQCNANRYGSDCSFATCQLDCCLCDTDAPTNCSDTCPANYDKSLAGSLTICAYRDRCVVGACQGTNYTACVSVDPALQTDAYKYQCSCTSGYQYPLANPTDKTKCEDIDECQFATFCDTSRNRTCQNTLGSFNCSCSPGFASATGSANCLDEDECTKSNGSVCQHSSCSNTVGSYLCNCNTGYYQDTSQRCTDINECANPATVNCTHQCANTPGGFNCTCFPGYAHPAGDTITCRADPACATDNTCTYKDLCTKISGTDTCRCAATQTLSGSTCSPTTFCTAGICGPNANCAEANPGYTCSCATHYELNSTRVCVKSQYCTDPSKYPGVCPSGGSFVCSVHPTTNAPTCVCATGYALSPSRSGTVCADMDECANVTTNGCQASSTDCRNTVGSYRCKCRLGYRRLNATHCVPAQYTYQVSYTYSDLVYSNDLANRATEAFKRMADLLETRIQAALPPDGTETPSARVFAMTAGSVVAATVASYATATSPAAIRASASTAGVPAVVSVTGFNQCTTVPGASDCSVEHNCVDSAAGYSCQCKIGYAQTGTRASFPSNIAIADCVDIDECLSECRNTAGGGNKVCVNTPGSYSCSCVNGTYSPDPKTGPCQDPCVPGRCLNGGACQYQVSDQFPYKCVCTAGYMGFNCELTDDNYLSMQRNAIIIGAVLGSLLLIALIIVIVCVIRKTTTSQQDSKRPKLEEPSTMRLESRTAAPTVAVETPPTPKHQLRAKDLHAYDASLDRPSEGNYRGRQPVPMAEASIPRVQQSAKHPSTYENQTFENDAGTRRQRSEYF